MTLNLKSKLLSLKKEAESSKEERVGFILRDYSFVEVPNSAFNKAELFLVHPEHFNKYIDKACVLWHTHIGKDPEEGFSDLDYRNMTAWPNLSNLLIYRGGFDFEYRFDNSFCQVSWAVEEILREFFKVEIRDR